MAKGQQRSNREIRKPKATKPTAPATQKGRPTQGVLAPTSVPLKKR